MYKDLGIHYKIRSNFASNVGIVSRSPRQGRKKMNREKKKGCTLNKAWRDREEGRTLKKTWRDREDRKEGCTLKKTWRDREAEGLCCKGGRGYRAGRGI